jgi:hypothetical protein
VRGGGRGVGRVGLTRWDCWNCSALFAPSLPSSGSGVGFRVGLRSWQRLGLLLLERRRQAVNGRSVTTYYSTEFFFFALRLKMASLGCNGKRSQNGH